MKFLCNADTISTPYGGGFALQHWRKLVEAFEKTKILFLFSF